MARKCATAAEGAPVFEYRLRIAQRRRNDAGIEVDQVSVIGGAAGGHTNAVSIVARGAGGILILNVTGMLGKTVVIEDAGPQMALVTEGIVISGLGGIVVNSVIPLQEKIVD